MVALFAPDERPTVEVCQGDGPFVVVCEHASNRLPRALGTLGLTQADLQRHIAWDPGAADLARSLAARLDGDLVVNRYSRLTVDCNRDHTLPDAFCTLSEDTEVPGNIGLSAQAKALRVAAIWTPFHAAIAGALDARRDARRPTALITVHSFTPVYRGVARPWHVGVISTDERSFADAMLKALRSDHGLVVGDNQPYSAKDNVDYTIRRHGRDRWLPHVMIEVRNDLLRSPEDVAAWTERLSKAALASAATVPPVAAIADKAERMQTGAGES